MQKIIKHNRTLQSFGRKTNKITNVLFHKNRRNMSADNYWEKQWQNQNTKWDTGVEHPELARIVNDTQSELYTKGRNVNFKLGLVPGCGSGYDVFTLCNVPGIEKVVGLDLAPTATQHAQQLAAEKGETYQKRTEFQNGDFFALPDQYGASVDLAFDYTFLCALDPSMREQWAKTYSQLMSKDGKLVTLIFPLEKRGKGLGGDDEGPPFIISLDLTKQLLEPLGFQCIYEAPVLTSITPRMNNEHLAIWQFSSNHRQSML